MNNSISSDGKTAAVSVVIVDTDGSARQETWTPTEDGRLLQHLQAAVGGLVDVVALNDDADMWVNDEGLYLCEPNPVATLLVAKHGHAAQPYFGAAVFTGGPDADGETCSLAPQLASRLLADAATARADSAAIELVRAGSERFATAYR